MYRLETYSYSELKDLCKKMDLAIKKSKNEMIEQISDAFKQYEKYKHDKLDKYTRKEKLGEGKEGVTYLVTDRKNREFAMKTFRPTKSSQKLLKEYNLQKKASSRGIAPKVYDYDTVSKYIVMEKMDKHLDFPLRKKDQKRILEIYKELDNIGILQNDVNIANYMVKDDKIYIIDFSLAKEIDEKMLKKEGENINFRLMTIGLVIRLKELGMPEKSFRYLLKAIPEKDREKYRL